MRHRRPLALLCIFLPSLLLGINRTSAQALAGTNPVKAEGHDHERERNRPLITITSPRRDARLSGQSISVELRISQQGEKHSLQVWLNRVPITGIFHQTGECSQAFCSFSGTVQDGDALRQGRNALLATVEPRDRHHDRESHRDHERVVFEWQGNSSGVGATPAPFYPPPAVGFTTLAPGGQQSGAWIQLSSNALHGGTETYPSSSETTCASTYQVLVLDRQTLAEISYSCYDTDATLSAGLALLVPADPAQANLVIAGTTLFHNAGPALNTTSIGGTNYSKVPAAQLPRGYMAIGEGGASGGATESYYLTSWLDVDPDPGSYLPQLNGILSTDATANYNFHPTDNTTFSVVNTQGDAGPTQIQVNNTLSSVTYAPPANSANGFWLLALKRTSLGNLESCDTNVSPTPCGVFYQTGNTDATTAQQQLTALGSALTGASSEQLLFLVSIGQAVNGTIPADLSTAIENLGGANQSLVRMSQNKATYNYTMISSNDPEFLKTYPGGNTVVSSNLNVTQGQTGSVYGLLSRGLNNLYLTATVNQGNVLTDAVVADQSLYQLAWRQPQPWPFMDTSGRQGAYRYLSAMVTGTVLGTGNASDDIRTLYPSSDNSDLVLYGHPEQIAYPAGGSWTDNVTGSVDEGTVFTFLASDMNSVAQQLSTELLDIGRVGSYMLGSTTNIGLRPSLIAGNTAAITAMLNAAGTAVAQLSLSTSTQTKVNPAALSNIIRANLALFSVIAPEAAPVLTVAGAALWLSTAASPLDKGSTGIPSPYNDIVKTFAELANATYQATYSANLGSGFDQMLDNLYNDWSELSTASANSLTVWKVNDQSFWDDVNTSMGNSSFEYYYSSLFASVYAIDVFKAQPATVTKPSLIGSTQVEEQPCHVICRENCVALYPSNISSNGWVKNGIGPEFDFLILGGPLSKNNSTSMHEDLPSSSALDTLFGTNISDSQLNLFSDQFFASNSIVPRRVGNDAPGFSEDSLCYYFGAGAVAASNPNRFLRSRPLWPTATLPESAQRPANPSSGPS
jgi:hypothetical protein